MSLRDARFWAVLTAVVVLVTGCQPSRPFYFFEDGDMSHYRGVATEVEYPDVNADTIPDVSASAPPLTLDNPEPREFWPLRLEEAVRVSLANSKVIRSIGGQIGGQSNVLNPPSFLSAGPATAQSVYAPAIVESDPRFGVEGTLSNFDTQWSTSVFWQKNDHPVNANFAGLLAGVLQEDAAQFQTQLAKVTAAGDRVFFRNNTNYDLNNNPTNIFPSFWTTNFEAEFRHPFLQGGGTQFNRIAGPSGIPGVGGFTNIPGVYNGVTIARTNVDIAIADFESQIRNVVNDTEFAYWELYFAYRNLDCARGRPRQCSVDLAKGQGSVRRRCPRRRSGEGSSSPRAILPVPRSSGSGGQPALRNGKPRALHDGHYGHRRAVDSSGRRSHDGQSRF